MLKRKFYDSLLRWKSSHGKECLLVKGARQIGKTFIIDLFGKRNYSSYLYLNFILDKTAAECFGDNLNADEIFKLISASWGIFELRTTLLLNTFNLMCQSFTESLHKNGKAARNRTSRVGRFVKCAH